MLYAALRIIPVEPIIATSGLRWNTPVSASISPAQFALSGTAALKIIKTKNRNENIGIYTVSPR